MVRFSANLASRHKDLKDPKLQDESLYTTETNSSIKCWHLLELALL